MTALLQPLRFISSRTPSRPTRTSARTEGGNFLCVLTERCSTIRAFASSTSTPAGSLLALLPASKALSEGRDAAPSLAHPSPESRSQLDQRSPTPDDSWIERLSLPPLRFGQSRLTIPNTCSTITVSASLRSDC